MTERSMPSTETLEHPSYTSIEVRKAKPSDIDDVYRIVTSCGLDVNSRYIYSMWLRDFSDTMSVAEVDGDIAAFIMCYARPQNPSRLFIWQAGVDSRFQGRGLAGELLRFVHGGRFPYVECTVAQSNSASLRFLAKFAQENQAEMKVEPFLTEIDLGYGHGEEDLITIGPIPTG